MDPKLVLPGTIVLTPTMSMGRLGRLYSFAPEQFVTDLFPDQRFSTAAASTAATVTTFGARGPTYAWIDQDGHLRYRVIERDSLLTEH